MNFIMNLRNILNKIREVLDKSWKIKISLWKIFLPCTTRFGERMRRKKPVFWIWFFFVRKWFGVTLSLLGNSFDRTSYE